MKTTLKSIKANLRATLAASLAALPLLLLAHASYADGDRQKGRHIENEDDEADYDDALEALRKGKALPLGTIRQMITKRWSGEIVSIEVKRRGGNLHYEFKVLQPNGHLTEIEVDAATGKILEVENE